MGQRLNFFKAFKAFSLLTMIRIQLVPKPLIWEEKFSLPSISLNSCSLLLSPPQLPLPLLPDVKQGGFTYKVSSVKLDNPYKKWHLSFQ